MSLDGAKFVRLDANDVPQGEAVLAKGRKFSVGYYASCDYVLEDARSKSVHCEIQCDAFGRVTVHNLCQEHPITVNDEVVGIKRLLLSGARISILDQTFIWEFPKIKTGEYEDLPDREDASTPHKQVADSPEQPPNSCPDLRLHREVPKRLTVHNFAYCIQSDEEGNTTVESPDTSRIEEMPQKIDSDATEIETAATASATSEKLDQDLPRAVERRSITPEPQPVPSLSMIQLDATPKMNLINCTKNKENASTEKKRKLISLCQQSDIVITSFSPRETGIRIEKTFTAVLKPASTPKSVYSTPKSILSDMNDDGSNDFIDFSTPATSKKNMSRLVTGNSSMHLIDLTTPSKLRPASPYLKSALKSSAKKQGEKPSGSQKHTNFASVLEEEDEKLGVTPLPATPIATPTASNNDKETIGSVGSVISVDSIDTSSVIEISGDDSTPGTTAIPSTPKTFNKSVVVKAVMTPMRTPQSLIKRALLTSAKKQTTTPKRTVSTTTTSGTTSTQSRKSVTGSPLTPQNVSNRAALLTRRQSLTTPTRKSLCVTRLDNSPSTSLGGPSTSSAAAAAARRSSLNPLAGRKLPSSTPLGASVHSNSRQRTVQRTSPLYKLRQKLGGTLSASYSKARKSIGLPSNRSSPSTSSQALSRSINSRSTPKKINTQKTPATTTPATILKNPLSAQKLIDPNSVLFTDNNTSGVLETVDLSCTFTLDSVDEGAATSLDKETKPKDVTFSPVKDATETKTELNKTFSPVKNTTDIKIELNKTFSPVKDTTKTKFELNKTFSPIKQVIEVESIESPLDIAEVKPIAQVETLGTPSSSTACKDESPLNTNEVNPIEEEIDAFSSSTVCKTNSELLDSKNVSTPDRRQIPTIVINSPEVITESFAEVIEDSFETCSEENVKQTYKVDEDITSNASVVVEDSLEKIKTPETKTYSQEKSDNPIQVDSQKSLQNIKESNQDIAKHETKATSDEITLEDINKIDTKLGETPEAFHVSDVSAVIEAVASKGDGKKTDVDHTKNISEDLKEYSKNIADCSVILKEYSKNIADCSVISKDCDLIENPQPPAEVSEQQISSDSTNEKSVIVIENDEVNNDRTLEDIDETDNEKTEDNIEKDVLKQVTIKDTTIQTNKDASVIIDGKINSCTIKGINNDQIKKIDESNNSSQLIENSSEAELKMLNVKTDASSITGDSNESDTESNEFSQVIEDSIKNITEPEEISDKKETSDDRSKNAAITTTINDKISEAEVTSTLEESTNMKESTKVVTTDIETTLQNNEYDFVKIVQNNEKTNDGVQCNILEEMKTSGESEETAALLEEIDDVLNKSDEMQEKLNKKSVDCCDITSSILNNEIDEANEDKTINEEVEETVVQETGNETNSEVNQHIFQDDKNASQVKNEKSNISANTEEKSPEETKILSEKQIKEPTSEVKQSSTSKHDFSEISDMEHVNSIKKATSIKSPPKTPNLCGMREMLRTPKNTAEPKTPRLAGLRNLLRTPKASKYDETGNLDGVQSLLQTPHKEEEPSTSKSTYKQEGLTFTPRRSTRRASTSADTNSACTPKRVTRRASLSAEAISTTTTLTPKRIFSRRPSIDEELSISTTQKKIVKRVTIFEDNVEDMGAIVEEESIIQESFKSTADEDKKASDGYILPSSSSKNETENVLIVLENKTENGDNDIIAENICEVITTSEKDISLDEKPNEQLKSADKDNIDSHKLVLREEITKNEVKFEDIPDNSLCEIVEESYEAPKCPTILTTLAKEGKIVVNAANEFIEPNKSEENILAENNKSVENLDQSERPTEKDEETRDEFLDDSEYDYGSEVAKSKVTENVTSATLEPGTPKTSKSNKIGTFSPKTPLMSGIRQLMKTPGPCAQTPKYAGLRDLVRTPPRDCSTPLLSGIKELMSTPITETPISHVHAVTFSELKKDEVNNVNIDEDKPECLDKFFNTPRAKNIMIPTLPPSAVIEKNTDSVELVHSTEYDLNDTNACTANLEDIFKTPVASRYAERTTDSINVDDVHDDEEIIDTTATTSTTAAAVSEKPIEKLNLSAEEAFDQMVGLPSVNQTPARKVYARKSLSSSIQQSPFSAADVISDLPKTDIQEWVDSLEETEIPSEDEEFNASLNITADEQEVTMNPDLVVSNEHEFLRDPLTASASIKNSPSLPNDFTNTTTASEVMLNVSTISSVADPLASSALTIANSVSNIQDMSVVEENSSEIPLTHIESDISGINLLDETEDSVSFEALQVSDTDSLDKTLEENRTRVEEENNSVIIEALVVTDTDSTNTTQEEKEGNNMETKLELSETIKNNEDDKFTESLVVSDTDSTSESPKKNNALVEEKANLTINVETNVATNVKIDISDSSMIDSSNSSVKDLIKKELSEDFEHFKDNSVLRDQISKSPKLVKSLSKLARKMLGAQEDLQLIENLKIKKEQLSNVNEITKKSLSKDNATQSSNCRSEKLSKITEPASVEETVVEISKTNTEATKALSSIDPTKENLEVCSVKTTINPTIRIDLEKPTTSSQHTVSTQNKVEEIKTDNLKESVHEELLESDTANITLLDKDENKRTEVIISEDSSSNVQPDYKFIEIAEIIEDVSELDDGQIEKCVKNKTSSLSSIDIEKNHIDLYDDKSLKAADNKVIEESVKECKIKVTAIDFEIKISENPVVVDKYTTLNVGIVSKAEPKNEKLLEQKHEIVEQGNEKIRETIKDNEKVDSNLIPDVESAQTKNSEPKEPSKPLENREENITITEEQPSQSSEPTTSRGSRTRKLTEKEESRTNADTPLKKRMVATESCTATELLTPMSKKTPGKRGRKPSTIETTKVVVGSLELCNIVEDASTRCTEELKFSSDPIETIEPLKKRIPFTSTGSETSSEMSTATPKRNPARRGRKPSTVETIVSTLEPHEETVEETPQQQNEPVKNQILAVSGSDPASEIPKRTPARRGRKPSIIEMTEVVKAINTLSTAESQLSSGPVETIEPTNKRIIIETSTSTPKRTPSRRGRKPSTIETTEIVVGTMKVGTSEEPLETYIAPIEELPLKSVDEIEQNDSTNVLNKLRTRLGSQSSQCSTYETDSPKRRGRKKVEVKNDSKSTLAPEMKISTEIINQHEQKYQKRGRRQATVSESSQSSVGSNNEYIKHKDRLGDQKSLSEDIIKEEESDEITEVKQYGNENLTAITKTILNEQNTTGTTNMLNEVTTDDGQVAERLVDIPKSASESEHSDHNTTAVSIVKEPTDSNVDSDASQVVEKVVMEIPTSSIENTVAKNIMPKHDHYEITESKKNNISADLLQVGATKIQDLTISTIEKRIIEDHKISAENVQDITKGNISEAVETVVEDREKKNLMKDVFVDFQETNTYNELESMSNIDRVDVDDVESDIKVLNEVAVEEHINAFVSVDCHGEKMSEISIKEEIEIKVQQEIDDNFKDESTITNEVPTTITLSAKISDELTTKQTNTSDEISFDQPLAVTSTKVVSNDDQIAETRVVETIIMATNDKHNHENVPVKSIAQIQGDEIISNEEFSEMAQIIAQEPTSIIEGTKQSEKVETESDAKQQIQQKKNRRKPTVSATSQRSLVDSEELSKHKNQLRNRNSPSKNVIREEETGLIENIDDASKQHLPSISNKSAKTEETNILEEVSADQKSQDTSTTDTSDNLVFAHVLNEESTTTPSIDSKAITEQANEKSTEVIKEIGEELENESKTNVEEPRPYTKQKEPQRRGRRNATASESSQSSLLDDEPVKLKTRRKNQKTLAENIIQEEAGPNENTKQNVEEKSAEVVSTLQDNETTTTQQITPDDAISKLHTEDQSTTSVKEQKTTQHTEHVEKQSSTVLGEEPNTDPSNQVPQKRGRRKVTVSETSQSSLHNDDDPSKRTTRRQKQNTPPEKTVQEQTGFDENTYAIAEQHVDKKSTEVAATDCPESSMSEPGPLLDDNSDLPISEKNKIKNIKSEPKATPKRGGRKKKDENTNEIVNTIPEDNFGVGQKTKEFDVTTVKLETECVTKSTATRRGGRKPKEEPKETASIVNRRVGTRGKKPHESDEIKEIKSEQESEEPASTFNVTKESPEEISKLQIESTEDETHHAIAEKTNKTKRKAPVAKRGGGRKKKIEHDHAADADIEADRTIHNDKNDDEPKKVEDIGSKKVTATPRRTRKASALAVDRQQSSTEDVSPSVAVVSTTTPPPSIESPKRERTTPRRAAAAHAHNYDESSDTETATSITRKPATNTDSATTSRGRTRKPTARVQQFLDEERAKAATPSKRRRLSATEVALAVETPTVTTPKRMPARRGRKPSTIERSEIVSLDTPQAANTKKAAPLRGGRTRTALAEESVTPAVEEPPSTHSSAESAADTHSSHVEDQELPAPSAKGRKRVARKATTAAVKTLKHTTADDEDGEEEKEPPTKKSPELLAAEKDAAAIEVVAAAIVEDVAAIAEPTKSGRGTRRAVAKTISYVEDPLPIEVQKEKPKSTTPRVGRAKAKAPPTQKRDQRLNSVSNVDDGSKDTAVPPVDVVVLNDEEEEDAPLAQVAATKRIALKTSSTDSPAMKRTRRKIVEDVETALLPTMVAKSPAPSATRSRRGRNVRFEATPEVASTSAAGVTSIASADETVKDVIAIAEEVPAVVAATAPPPAKRATRTRRK